jgi:putrescine transport system substrate-binding protein
MRGLVRLSCAILALCLAAPSGAQEFSAPVRPPERTLSILAWSDYFAPEVLAAFEGETGIKLIYDTYQSNAGLETALSGDHSYDVIVLGGQQLPRAIAAGQLQKLEKQRLGNARNVAGELMSALSTYDPGNQYAVPYMWFTTLIAFNMAMAKARLGDIAPNSWDVVFRPEILKRFADCGVELVDSPVDLIANAIMTLKLGTQARSAADVKRAADFLMRLRPNIRQINLYDYGAALARGDICLAVGWTGEAIHARLQAQEANAGVEIGLAIPKEGTVISLDVLAVPRGAPHPAEAHQFIDFLLSPENAARNSRATGLATSIPAARPLLDAAIANDPAIYPPPDVMKRLFTAPNYDRMAQDVMAREWARMKSGK